MDVMLEDISLISEDIDFSFETEKSLRQVVENDIFKSEIATTQASDMSIDLDEKMQDEVEN